MPVYMNVLSYLCRHDTDDDQSALDELDEEEAEAFAEYKRLAGTFRNWRANAAAVSPGVRSRARCCQHHLTV
jgi:hypothetical protein